VSYSDKMIHCALRYAESGWFVLPLIPRGKRPLGSLVPKGVLDASRHEQTIGTWFQGTGANLGIATGKKSGIWVLDIDGPVGSLVWWDWEAQNGHCFTLAQRTGRRDGGRQLFFNYPVGYTIKSRTGVMTGVDVRADSGYVVAPPSVHPSGKNYVWEGKVPINKAPLKLLELIGARKTHKPTSGAQNKTSRSSNYGPTVRAGLLQELSSCPRGGRDQLAFRVATRLLELEKTGDIRGGQADEIVHIGLTRCGYIDDPRKERGERGFQRIMSSARKRIG